MFYKPVILYICTGSIVQGETVVNANGVAIRNQNGIPSKYPQLPPITNPPTQTIEKF